METGRAGGPYELLGESEVLGWIAIERMLAGLSTRCYLVGLEPVRERFEKSARSRASRRSLRWFVAAAETAMAELLAAPLGERDLVALMIGGGHLGEHLCVVVLGIWIDGVKHPLGLIEGSTENATAVTDLLTGLRDPGLENDSPDLRRRPRRQGSGRGRPSLRASGDRSPPTA